VATAGWPRASRTDLSDHAIPVKTPSKTGPLAEKLIGTWSLRSREDYNAAGERRIEPSLGSDPIALLYFDRGGNFAAQFMKRDRSSAPTVDAASGLPNNSRARGGYDGYFGTYVVDESTGVVSTLLLAAISPENVGQTFQRQIQVDGDILTLRLATATATGEPVTRTLKWQRVG